MFMKNADKLTLIFPQLPIIHLLTITLNLMNTKQILLQLTTTFVELNITTKLTF